MHRLICCCLFPSVMSLAGLLAAPAPERKSAKPAIIKGEIESAVVWVLTDLPPFAPYAFNNEYAEASRLDIIRRHRKDTQIAKDLEDFRAWVKKNLRVERVRGTNQVRVSFRGGTPQEQAAIINCIVDDFFKCDINFRRETEMRQYELGRQLLANPRNMIGKTPEQIAKDKKELESIHEDRIRALPVIVEHAKAR